jgi:hypothetical protein
MRRTALSKKERLSNCLKIDPYAFQRCYRPIAGSFIHSGAEEVGGSGMGGVDEEGENNKEEGSFLEFI